MHAKVTDSCYPRHRGVEFLEFLKLVVKAWLAKHPRIQLHFTPTHSSWMNLVESFFSIITRQAIRRASFTSVRQVTDAIRTFVDGWNDRCVPFVWTKTADEILAVANRQGDSVTDH